VVTLDAPAIARELIDAYRHRRILPVPLSVRDPSFDLSAAYAVEAELVRSRLAEGHSTVGRKVGYANKALWRALKLETLVWAHMYDDTVTYADGAAASLAIGRMCAPKIEPEIVFKLRTPLDGASGPAEVLRHVEWIALGFEIIDCVFADWKFQPADFVAAFGLHAALVVGEPRAVDAATIPELAEQLARFTLKLSRNGDVVADGSGKNSLRSPALCLAELSAATSRQTPAEPLAAGELVSSGTLTESQPIAAGETWSAIVEGIDMPSVTVHISDSDGDRRESGS
jgi:2-oxo-3-hexenedioate decarboxylase